MRTLYKLTDQNLRTHGGFQWAIGIAPPELPGDGALCTAGYYHSYTDPLLAVLLNPIHADIQNPRLFEAWGDVAATDSGLKVGGRSLRLLREIPVPQITLTQRIAFGILCSLELHQSREYRDWAEGWLSGKDRSEAAARAAEAAWAAAAAQAWSAEAAEAAAARAAEEAEEAAVRAAAEWAEWAAARAARAEEAAAAAAAAAGQPLDLIAIAQKSLKC